MNKILKCLDNCNYIFDRSTFPGLAMLTWADKISH